LGREGDGWKVAITTLMNERVSLSGAGSIGGEAVGGSPVQKLIDKHKGTKDPLVRQALAQAYIESTLIRVNNQRAAAKRKSGSEAGPEGSITKLQQAELNQRIQNLAIDLEGVSDIVQLAGFVPDTDLRTLLHRAGCAVIPSLYEPFGIVALEAMAAGAPTIVARTGGLAEILDGTGAGLLFEPGSAEELASAIEKVLTDPGAAAALASAAADLLGEHYSWDAIAVSTLAVYAQALR
jgi:hypothetical protein